MAIRTRIDLVNHALGILGVLAAGQTPVAEDFTAVDGHVEELFAVLDRRDIVTVDDDDEIPIEWFDALATLLADQAAPFFGMPGLPPSPSAPNPVLAAETQLREVAYARPTYEPLRSEYY